MKEKLTKSQQDALEKICERHTPGVWFKFYDLPHIVRRPEYTCRVLTNKGHLEMRYTEERFSPEFRLPAETTP